MSTLFGTPFVSYQWPDSEKLNQDLIEVILANEQSDNVVHTHPNALWSVVYYVSAGEPDESMPYCGLLELLDPRESANCIQVPNTILDQRALIENVPGKMILFPSWANHMVHPFVGSGVRISIANNVSVVEKFRTPQVQEHAPATATSTLRGNST